MTNDAPSPANPSHGEAMESTLLQRLRDRIRYRHYSLRTEHAYGEWVRRYLRYHGRRHPRELGAEHVTAYLSSLATVRHVAASTQNQALAAILFLYREVLGIDLPWMQGIARAKKPRRLPVVLTRLEVQALLASMQGTHALMAKLMYGTGMRLMECLGLRVKDIELARHEVMVRQGKGGKDRVTMLPVSLVEEMTAHLRKVRKVFEADRAAGVAGVELPFAYAAKNPAAGTSWGWHWVFPQQHLSVDPR